MKIDLSAEERRLLLRLIIRDALDSTKYPLAPVLKVLRDLADKQGARLMPPGCASYQSLGVASRHCENLIEV
jgi:hypothetical protein